MPSPPSAMGSLDDLRVGDDAAHARRDGARDVGGAQAALERVGCDDDAQRAVDAGPGTGFGVVLGVEDTLAS